VLSWLEAEEARLRHPAVSQFRGNTLAMLGLFDQARAVLAGSRDTLLERGALVMLGTHLSHSVTNLEMLAGDPGAAVEAGLEGCRLLEEAGERSWLSTGQGYVAGALYALGRLEEAEEWAGRALDLGPVDDVITQMLARQVRAKVAARRGRHEEAERLAREALALGLSTQMPVSLGDAYADLGEVLALAGRRAEATQALEEALALYERKRAPARAARARAQLEPLL
jgi:tetratricopeptide (TPR) repeat protein